MRGPYHQNVKFFGDTFNDVLERIAEGITTGNGAVRFLARSLPSNYEPKRPASPASLDARLTKAERKFFSKTLDDWLSYAGSQLYLNFYEPYIESAMGKQQRSLRYEAFIPFEQFSKWITRFFVFHAGAATGERIPLLSYCYVNDASIPRQRIGSPGYKAGGSVNQTTFLKYVDKILKGQRELGEDMGDPFIHWGLGSLPSQPGIRLPCYNVPMQCAYEMVVADVGNFFPDAELYHRAVQNRQTLLILKRRPLRLTMLASMLLWPTWIAGKLSEVERLDMLMKVCQSVGETCDYKDGEHALLRVQCLRIFKKHFCEATKGACW